jgi:hypothetical protein
MQCLRATPPESEKYPTPRTGKSFSVENKQVAPFLPACSESLMQLEEEERRCAAMTLTVIKNYLFEPEIELIKSLTSDLSHVSSFHT